MFTLYRWSIFHFCLYNTYKCMYLLNMKISHEGPLLMLLQKLYYKLQKQHIFTTSIVVNAAMVTLMLSPSWMVPKKSCNLAFRSFLKLRK